MFNEQSISCPSRASRSRGRCTKTIHVTLSPCDTGRWMMARYASPVSNLEEGSAKRRLLPRLAVDCLNLFALWDARVVLRRSRSNCLCRHHGNQSKVALLIDPELPWRWNLKFGI